VSWTNRPKGKPGITKNHRELVCCDEAGNVTGFLRWQWNGEVMLVVDMAGAVKASARDFWLPR